jgi:S1-C subfamily serine protease
MRPLDKAVVVVVILVALAFAAWKTTARWRGPAAISANGSARSTITNSINFVRSRVTGGIGVAMAMDSRTGLPKVGAVAVDSPAEHAGIRVGDMITKVGGIATTGLALTQIVERVRGFSAGSVALTVSRQGTNMELEINRSSWNAMKDKKYHPYE